METLKLFNFAQKKRNLLIVFFFVVVLMHLAILKLIKHKEVGKIHNVLPFHVLNLQAFFFAHQ